MTDGENDFEDSDSVSDFVYFDQEEIDIRPRGVITNVEMNNDNYFPWNDVDIENGWGKIDTPPINILFTKDVRLNLQMDSTTPDRRQSRTISHFQKNH